MSTSFFSIKSAMALHLWETEFFSSAVASQKDFCKSSEKKRQSYPNDLSPISSVKIFPNVFHSE